MSKRKVSAATRRKLSQAAKKRARKADGSFASRRSNPSKRRASSSSRKPKRRAAARRTTSKRRRNPDMGVSGFTGVLLDGAVGAATLTTSKIATRTVPELFKQDRTSNVGLGVQLATAVAFGFLADMVAGPSWGTWVLAGALTAPLEDAAVRFQVPYVADKLQPGTGGTVGIYASRRGRPRASVRAPAPTSRRLPAARGMADWITPFIGNGAGVSA